VAGFFNVRFLLFLVPRFDDFFDTFLVGGGALATAGTALACACSITTTSSSLVRRRYSTTMTTMTRHQIMQHTALAKIMSHSIGKGCVTNNNDNEKMQKIKKEQKQTY